MEDRVQGFFPRFIDKPRLIGIFEIDEFFLFFATMSTIVGASLIFPNLESTIAIIFALFIGGLFVYFYKKFKKNMPIGYAFQFLYRKGIIHPRDIATKAWIRYPYLKKIKLIPYGFVNEFYN